VQNTTTLSPNFRVSSTSVRTYRVQIMSHIKSTLSQSKAFLKINIVVITGVLISS